MINHDFFYFESLFQKTEIDNINRLIAGNESIDQYKNQSAYGKKACTKILDTNIFDESFLNKWHDSIISINRHFFGFQLYDQFPSYTHINSYYQNDEYPWHRDSKNYGDKCDIKFTSILNISVEKYQGGEFELFLGTDNDGIIKPLNKSGALLVFPSFLYHRVAPVVHGCRRTMTIWFEGPSFS